MFRRNVLAVILPVLALVVADDPSRHLDVINESQSKLDIYWVHPVNKEKTIMNPKSIPKGGTFPLDTFVGHEFEIRELPSPKTGVCNTPDQTCRSHSFSINENDKQIVRVDTDFRLKFSDNMIEAQAQAGDIITECRKRASSGSTSIDDLLSCYELGVSRTLEKINEEISFQSKMRVSIADALENYTCVDDTLDTTPDIATEIWNYRHEMPRTVHIKHRRPASQIHVVENFIDDIECQAMADEAQRSLHRATVADGKGGSRLSENRKAMQAGIKVQWSKEAEGDAIARLSRRVYDYTNYVLELDIHEHGQEDLMSIQYFGRGRNDTEPDRYTPHCDGDCTGLPHKNGTRMATMVMYCDVPESGGHTNFRNAGVHVKPDHGNAIFFSYIDPSTRLTDTGFTEHSGCPVFEGVKRIVTQWIRLGVDAENPWDSFNTLGIKRSEAAEQ